MTATYKEISTSKQFNLSSDNKSLTLTSTSESQTLITITGLKEGLSAVDGAIEGITIDGTTVKLTQSVLGTNNVSIEGDYTLAFDGEVDTPESAAAHFEDLTYKSASNTAGYTLADDNKSITYTEEVAAKDLSVTVNAPASSFKCVVQASITFSVTIFSASCLLNLILAQGFELSIVLTLQV